jgi:hypothetical protein
VLPVAVGTIRRAISLDNLALLDNLAPLVVVAVPVDQVVAAEAVNLVVVDLLDLVELLVAVVVVHHVVLVLLELLEPLVVVVVVEHPVVAVNLVNPVNLEPLEELVLLDKVANPVNPVDPVVIGVNLHLVALLVVKVVALLRVANMK